jgi:hypothetical protein
MNHLHEKGRYNKNRFTLLRSCQKIVMELQIIELQHVISFKRKRQFVSLCTMNTGFSSQLAASKPHLHMHVQPKVSLTVEKLYYYFLTTIISIELDNKSTLYVHVEWKSTWGQLSQRIPKKN